MREGWEIKKLGEVCIVERGSSPRPIEKYQTDSSDGVNWIKIDKYIYKTKEKITKEGAEKSRYVKGGDFILSNSMSFGKPYIMKTDGYIHDGWFVFRLPDYLDKDFFYYLLTSAKVQKQIQSLGAGAIVKNISGDLVKKVDITFPKSLSEQQRIVAILDEAFSAIDKAMENAEKNLKNAKELFESYLQGLFENKGDGWKETTLGEISFVKSGGTPSRAIKEYWEGDIPWYSSGELNDLFTRNPERHINQLAVNNSNTKIFPKGSLLIGMYDTAALKMSIIDRNATFNQAIAGVEPNKNIDLIFILHSINSIKPELLNLRRGVRQKNLSLEKIKNIPICLPSLKKQKIIVKALDDLSAKTQKLEFTYHQKLSDLEELKKSILQKAFNGELNTAV
jgi:type I restriction enzyme S subunit